MAPLKLLTLLSDSFIQAELFSWHACEAHFIDFITAESDVLVLQNTIKTSSVHLFTKRKKITQATHKIYATELFFI